MILSNREIHNDTEKLSIIQKSLICHIGLVDGNKPYVLPFNFAYEEGFVYIHSGPVGKKTEILKVNNNICIVFNADNELFHRHENVACTYSMKYRSVVVDGHIEFVEEYEEKIRIMNLIMKKYTGRDDFKYNAPAVKNVSVMKVHVDKMTGKQFGF